jgi:hypothetical protein
MSVSPYREVEVPIEELERRKKLADEERARREARERHIDLLQKIEELRRTIVAMKASPSPQKRLQALVYEAVLRPALAEMEERAKKALAKLPP